MITAAEQRLFRSVSDSAKTLMDQAEHVFRNMFRAHVAVGAFMPTHGAEQNSPFSRVFRCFAISVDKSAPWKKHHWRRPIQSLNARHQLPRLIAFQILQEINSLQSVCRACAVLNMRGVSTYE